MKKRLLEILKEKFSEYSSKELYSYILCGEVRVNGCIIKDPKLLVETESDFTFNFSKYVSRGAYKLEKALDAWKIDVKDKIILDAGCSTGGWTDLLLQRGAKKVYAVDVGFNQLDLKLRKDPRVVVMEKCNIMALEDLIVDFAVADISFRSIVQPALKMLSFSSSGKIIVLVKPQFEWENPPVSFNGVVENEDDLQSILADVREKFKSVKIEVLDEVESPIKGHKGNREFLFLLKKFN